VSKLAPNLSKSSKAQPSLDPNKSKKKALISLDSLGDFEPFQWLAATPWGKKIFRLHLGSPEGFALTAIPQHGRSPSPFCRHLEHRIPVFPNFSNR
jgi:hypothetical protein